MLRALSTHAPIADLTLDSILYKTKRTFWRCSPFLQGVIYVSVYRKLGLSPGGETEAYGETVADDVRDAERTPELTMIDFPSH